MTWHSVFERLESTAHQSVIAGKYYIVFWLAVRSTLVLSLGKQTFSGELSDFDCDTNIIGCTEMCFNNFSPVSLQRYWVFQLLSSSLPSVIFIIYGQHTLNQVQNISEIRKKIRKKQITDVRRWKERIEKSNKKELHLSETDLRLPTNSIIEKKLLDDDDMKNIYKSYFGKGHIPFRKNLESPSKVIIAYFWMIILKVLIDLVFSFGQYYIYPFHFLMGAKFDCYETRPCNADVVSCWPFRPFEKTICWEGS